MYVRNLKRFREHFSPSANSFVQVPVTQELRERYHLDNMDQRMREKSLSFPEGSQRVLYRFPVSKFDHLNENGRNYPKKLWENVINGQKHIWQNYVGLADHPEGDSDGEFKNAAVVWHDMEIDPVNKLIWAVASFVGEFGRLAQEIVDAGGRVGFSSSGLGELMYDNQTVNPDTFVIERVADIVLNPSQKVFGDATNSLNIEYGKQPVKESIEEKKMQEGASPIQAPISKMEEKKFERDIRSFLEDVDKISSPQERLSELTEILSYFETGAAPSLKEKVEGRIKEEQNRLEQLLREAQETRQELGAPEEIKKSVALMAEEAKVVMTEAKEWEKIAVTLRDQTKVMEEKIKGLKAKLNSRPTATQYTEMKESSEASIAKAQAKQKELREELQKRTKQLAHAEKRFSELESINTRLKRTIKAMREEVKGTSEELQVSFAEAQETATFAMEKLKESESKSSSLTDQIADLQAKLKESEELVASKGEELSKVQESKADLEAKYAELETSFVDFKENANKIPMEASFADKMEGVLNFRESQGVTVENYWRDLVSRYGEGIAPYERTIRGAKTYREATAAFMRALPSLSPEVELARIPEGLTKLERKQMLEEAGMEFGKRKTMVSRMPKGFQ